MSRQAGGLCVIAEWISCGPCLPLEGQRVLLKCRDHLGLYELPFDCVYQDGEFYNAADQTPIKAQILRWRAC